MMILIIMESLTLTGRVFLSSGSKKNVHYHTNKPFTLTWGPCPKGRNYVILSLLRPCRAGHLSLPYVLPDGATSTYKKKKQEKLPNQENKIKPYHKTKQNKTKQNTW